MSRLTSYRTLFLGTLNPLTRLRFTYRSLVLSVKLSSWQKPWNCQVGTLFWNLLESRNLSHSSYLFINQPYRHALITYLYFLICFFLSDLFLLLIQCSFFFSTRSGFKRKSWDRTVLGRKNSSCPNWKQNCSMPK